MEKPRIRVPARSVPLVALPAVIEPTRNRRFKVQQRVELTARDHAGKPFLLGEVWRTVVQADKQATAEKRMLALKGDTRHSHRAYRIAEEWPFGSALRIIK